MHELVLAYRKSPQACLKLVTQKLKVFRDMTITTGRITNKNGYCKCGEGTGVGRDGQEILLFSFLGFGGFFVIVVFEE